MTREQAPVLITRHSRFTNVADTFQIGNHESAGNASGTAYQVPPGYWLDPMESTIRDSDGYPTAIVLDADNCSPRLISLGASRCNDVVLCPVIEGVS